MPINDNYYLWNNPQLTYGYGANTATTITINGSGVYTAVYGQPYVPPAENAVMTPEDWLRRRIKEVCDRAVN